MHLQLRSRASARLGLGPVLPIVLLPIVLSGCGKVCWFGCGDDPGVEKPPVAEVGCPDEGTVATWENFAEGYTRTYCTPCHSSGLDDDERYGAPVGVDFDTYDDIVAQSAIIRAWATGPDPLMPPVGGPSDEDRALLREWIDCGLPGGELGGSVACSAEPNHLPGDLVVSSDDDVASFCATYNGVAGNLQVLGAVDLALDCVCEVTGDVEIGGQARSVNLPELTYVHGNVEMRAAAALTSVQLTKLGTIDGDLEVVDNPLLTSLSLPTLDEVGGSLIVEGNSALPILWTSQLERTGGDWSVVGNASLVQVSTDHLLEIGGSFVLDDNAALGFMAGQAYAVESIGGDILIRDNPSLEYPELAFQELLYVGGDVELVNNDSFTRVDAFEKLAEIPGHLWIRDNKLVTVINGLDSVVIIGESLDISNNSAMVLIDGAFRVLEDIGGVGDQATGEHQLRIQDNPMLASLGDLVDVQFVGGIVISGNGSLLTTLSGFDYLQAVDDSIEVYGNTGLVTLDAFGALTQLGGDYLVHDNPALFQLSGLETVVTLPTSLRVERNASLGLVSFGSPAKPFVGVAGDLVFVDNDSLYSLPALSALKTVGGDLVLTENAALVDLTGLYALVTVGSGLVVTWNPALPTSNAEALRDAIDVIGGSVTIEGNAP